MDLMFWVQFLVVAAALGIGAKWNGIGLGTAGGIGLAILVFVFGIKPGSPPISVLLIMVSMLCCVSILQGCGGLDYLVSLAKKILKKNPKYITFLGPLVCYFFTLFCGTGYVAFSVFPVIAEVAIAQRVRPERPLAMSVISSQAGITGSPMSAATAAMIGFLAVKGVTPFQIFAVSIPACLIGVLIGCAFMYKRGKELADDPEFQKRVASGDFKDAVEVEQPITNFSKQAKLGVVIFAIGVAAVIFYGTFPNLLPHFDVGGKVTRLSTPNMLQILMLCAAGLIMVLCRVDPMKLSSGSVFRAGLIGMCAVYGISWMTDTFFEFYTPVLVKEFGMLVQNMPILFALCLFFLSAMLFSQGATLTALLPLAMTLNIAPSDLVWMFPAANGVFFIPAGGAIIGCIAFDRTGTTKIGKFIFNHSYMLPGLVTTISQLCIGYVIAKFIF